MSLISVKLAAVKAANTPTRRSPPLPPCSADTYYTFIYRPSESPDTRSKQFGNIPANLTNEFLNIQKETANSHGGISAELE